MILRLPFCRRPAPEPASEPAPEPPPPARLVLVPGQRYNVPGFGPGYHRLDAAEPTSPAIYRGTVGEPPVALERWDTDRGERLVTTRWIAQALDEGLITPAP